jgi:hypothetical protein
LRIEIQSVPESITRSAKLIPYTRRPRTGSGFATSFIFEAPPEQGDDLGSLAVVIEVLCASKQAEEVAEIIIHSIGDTYYNTPINDPLPQDRSERELRFENALRTANSELSSYTTSGHAAWVGKLSAIVAVVSPDMLQLSSCGSPVAYLYRASKIKNIIGTEDSPGTSDTIFNNVVLANLRNGDKILFATPVLPQLVTDQELRSILSDHQPNSVIHILADSVKGRMHSDRLSSIVVEVTTINSISDEQLTNLPPVSSLGADPSYLDDAQVRVGSAARTTLTLASRLRAWIISIIRIWIMPRAKRLSLGVLKAIRKMLHQKNGPLVVVGLILITIILAFMGGISYLRHQSLGRFGQKYTDLRSLLSRADAEISVGDKAKARIDLLKAKSDLDNLISPRDAKELEKNLPSLGSSYSNLPKTTAVADDIQTKIDSLDGLVKLHATRIASFTTVGTKPSLFEMVGNKGIFYDQVLSQFSIYDFQNNKVSQGANSKPIGSVVAMAASSAGEGVFVLTDKPSVWLYSSVDGSLIEQTVGFGTWPKGRSIASYNSNLYILAADSSQIYKFGRTLSGFTGKSSYLQSSETTSLNGAKSIVVDGSVYLASTNGINRFLSGHLTSSSTDQPGSLSNPGHIRLASEGTILLTIDATSGRIGETSFDGEKLLYRQQFQVVDIKDIADIVPDSRSKNLYILGDGQLWRATPNL